MDREKQRLEQDKHVTDRFSNAIGQLGSADEIVRAGQRQDPQRQGRRRERTQPHRLRPPHSLAAAQQAIATDWATAETALGVNQPTTTQAAPPPVPPTHAPTPATTQPEPPAPAPTQQEPPSNTDPLAGKYRAGEFCSKTNLGVTTTATNGATITCRRDGNYNRWQY